MRESTHHNPPVVEPDLSFVRFNDTHFGADREWSGSLAVPEFCSVKRTELILDAIAAEETFDFILHGGDVVDRGDTSFYAPFNRLMEERFAQQLYYVIGNHDRLDAFLGELQSAPRENLLHDEGKLSFTFRYGKHHFVVVDGRLDDFQRAKVGPVGIDWLKERLAAVPKGEFAWPVFHFPPIRFSPDLAPRLVLEDGEEVHQALAAYPETVRMAMYAHIHHQVIHQQLKGPVYLSGPTASVPMIAKKKSGYQHDPHGSVGYEVIHLFPDGHFSLELRHVDVSKSLRA